MSKLAMEMDAVRSEADTLPETRPATRDSAPGVDLPASRLVWFLGPRPSSWNGVNQHSLLLMQSLRKHTGFEIEAVDMPARPRTLKRYWWQFVRYPLRAIQAARAGDIVILYQEDLSFMVPFVKLMRGRICVLFHHVQHGEHAHGLIEKLKYLYVQVIRPCVMRADLVLVLTDVTARELTAVVPVEPARLKIVPCPFEEKTPANEAMTRSQARAAARAVIEREFGVSLGDSLVLLNVGSDETRKNNVPLFRSLAYLNRKDVVVVRVGVPFNTKNREACIEAARDANVPAHFIEGISDANLRYFYDAADIYVSPTLHEGFGRTVIEAQMQGVPVIASDLAVYRTVMGNTFYPVADPMDPRAWAAAIEHVASDPEIAERFEAQGRRNASRFAAEVVCRALKSSLDELTSADARRARTR